MAGVVGPTLPSIYSSHWSPRLVTILGVPSSTGRMSTWNCWGAAVMICRGGKEILILDPGVSQALYLKSGNPCTLCTCQRQSTANFNLLITTGTRPLVRVASDRVNPRWTKKQRARVSLLNLNCCFHTCVCTRVYFCTCLSACMCVCAYWTHAYVWMHAYVCVWLCMWVCVSVLIWGHATLLRLVLNFWAQVILLPQPLD